MEIKQSLQSNVCGKPTASAVGAVRQYPPLPISKTLKTLLRGFRKNFPIKSTILLIFAVRIIEFFKHVESISNQSNTKNTQSGKFRKKAWLFGSYSRNEETSQSDVDIMFEKTENVRFGLIQFTSTILQLENALGKKIDLIPISTMLECVKKDANINKILLYERS